uniref:Uncharacterized protein n=1 Tax=viral metagenome TaxID=1070528 RepID=A0A6C0L5J0_9ZZZZ
MDSSSIDAANDKRITDGKQFAEFLWWTLAKRIVGIAGELYKWDESQWEVIKEKFLRNNDYAVVAKY